MLDIIQPKRDCGRCNGYGYDPDQDFFATFPDVEPLPCTECKEVEHAAKENPR